MAKEIEIWNAIKLKKIVSFDIFDTLLKRNVSHPRDIFHIVEFIYNQKNKEKIDDFYNKRVNAEKTCRENTEREEITLFEIYETIDYTQEISTELKEIEIETELQFCQINYNLLNIYKKCIENGIRVVLTSDMYLPENVIKQLLKKNGVTGYDKLYLSSAIGKQKGTGNLYKYVLDDLGINATDIIHIGDGFVTDYIRPLQKGVKSVHIKRNRNNLSFVSDEKIFNENNLVWNFANNNINIYREKSDVFRAGYEAFGPLILGFSYWIHQKMSESRNSKVFFLARDMYLFLDVFQKLFPDDEVVYLEASRRSLRRAYVKSKGDLKEVLNTVGRKQYNVRDICDILEIQFDSIKSQLLDIGINEYTSFNNIIELAEKYDGFQKIAMSYLCEQTDYTEEYLKQKRFYDYEKPIIVDIGWHGTIQNMLESIADRSIKGLYLGNTKRKNYTDMEADGYWFNSDDELDTITNISIVGILETMLFPNIGTTIGYKEEKDGITPIHRESEAFSYDVIDDFQNGALTFIEDVICFLNKTDIGKNILGFFDMSAATCMEGYINMAYRPSLKYAECFGDLDYEDNHTVKLASPKSVARYLFSPKLFIKDYRDCKWKTGFLKRLFPLCVRPDIIDAVIKRINNR